MIEIGLSGDFAAAGVAVTLGCLACRLTVEDGDPTLQAALEMEEARRLEMIGTRPIAEIPEIAAARHAYRRLGKDPTRYRVSSEALMRRLVKGQGLYRINTAVDAGNLISLKCGHAIGAFDRDRLHPPLVFRKAAPGETFEAIGRGPMNLESLPVFADAEGPFGSPTSDSERSKIRQETQRLLLVIIAFGTNDPDALSTPLAFAADCLIRYCAATDIETDLVASPV